MAKKHKTVKELNIEFDNLSERIKKLEDKETTKDLDTETGTKLEGIEKLLKTYDEKIKDLLMLFWIVI